MNVQDSVKQHLPSEQGDGTGINQPSPAEQEEKQSYKAWAQNAYNSQYESWMPWIEDQYLRWFGKGDNKASYATKDSLSKTKVTGIDQVDQVQDDTSNLVGNQIGDKGLLSPVGQFVSKEGINRTERGGKDERGEFLGGQGTQTGGNGGGLIGSIGSGVSGGVEGVKGVLGGGGK
ncbi:hypothetical protein N7481_007020 [Penicillium waksmanii]|uniref:uncharacterized protein n=1 Tax=Penicillium waksmanii TaxID=69791 RepID=UPI0025487173|nr:uncharacterized protein N7481_007020 [Penicillium waksmanii]KAJ5979722.1 hypothetical protein N7481_007020 [Penicillium waksmanii]